MTSFAARVGALPPLGAGLGYRGPLHRFFAADNQAASPSVGCVEVVAEHFFSERLRRPAVLGDRPVMVHGLDLSLGTPEALDYDYVKRLLSVVHRLDAVLLSDHLAFTHAGGVELGHLNPVAPTRANVAMIAEKIREVVEITDQLFLLENITTHLSLHGELSAAEFYQAVCDEADCGMLLDVTNILVNCHNRSFDPLRFIDELDLSRVVQLHIVGYSARGERWYDNHVTDIGDDVFDFAAEVVARAPVKAILYERDGHWPKEASLRAELERLDSLLACRRQEAA